MQGPIYRAVWLPLLWRSVQVWKAGKDRAGEDTKHSKAFGFHGFPPNRAPLARCSKRETGRTNIRWWALRHIDSIPISSTLINSQPGGGSQEGVDGKWKGGLPHHSTQVLLWSATIMLETTYWLWQNFENSHHHYREIRILQLLRHENIVNLIEICRTKVFFWE